MQSQRPGEFFCSASTLIPCARSFQLIEEQESAFLVEEASHVRFAGLKTRYYESSWVGYANILHRSYNSLYKCGKLRNIVKLMLLLLRLSSTNHIH